jgi:hypothetical protein
MRLLASLMNDNRWHELLAEIDPITDSAKQGDDLHVHRFIVGIICRLGPIWHDFITFWQNMSASGIAALNPQLAPGELEGHVYFMANLLQVDHDLYTSPAAINVEDSTIRLVLTELYSDPIEEYAEQVRERNQQVEDLRSQFEQGQMTVNAVRAFRGSGPLPAPHGTRLIPADQLASIRKSILDNPTSQLARNYIY